MSTLPKRIQCDKKIMVFGTFVVLTPLQWLDSIFHNEFGF